MGNEVYQTRVIPLVRMEKKNRNGRVVEEKVDNLTVEEMNKMSCDPRMLWRNGDRVYMAEMPLTYRGTSVKWSLFYVFDELTAEEQEKYYSRSIVIPTTIKDVVQVYGESSKSVFTRRKKKSL